MAWTSEGAKKRDAKLTPQQKKARARIGGRAKGKSKKKLLKLLALHEFTPDANTLAAAAPYIPSPKPIWEMTEQEAEDQLGHELSPAHHMLWEKRRLCMIAEEGGTAGVAALKELKAMRQEVAPTGRKAVVVSFQPIARDAEGA